MVPFLLACTDPDEGVEHDCGRSRDEVASVDLDIVFRPWKTDDVVPGYEGAPWDWDGSIPGWIQDVVDALDGILEVAQVVVPSAEVLSVAQAVDAVDQILDVVDEYGPTLLEPYIPPDPRLTTYSFSGQQVDYDETSEREWEDSYEVALTVRGLNLDAIDGVVIDAEDLDVAFNDNMGDWADQGGDPIVLTSDLLAQTAGCTAVYYNPDNAPQASELAYLPGSVLWMSYRAE